MVNIIDNADLVENFLLCYSMSKPLTLSIAIDIVGNIVHVDDIGNKWYKFWASPQNVVFSGTPVFCLPSFNEPDEKSEQMQR